MAETKTLFRVRSQTSKSGTSRYVVVRESPSGSITKVVNREMHELGLRAASKVLSHENRGKKVG